MLERVERDHPHRIEIFPIDAILDDLGFVRFILLVTLLQFMASLPIKMVLRWSMNLKYIVAIPEIFFNI